MAFKFKFDEDHCTGCKSCVVACKDKYDLGVNMNYRKVNCQESGAFPHVKVNWSTTSCEHCDNPECVSACPTGACYKREEDGIVLIDSEVCIGCKMCMEACPYDSPIYNAETNKCEKCDGCIDLVLQGKKPYCVQVCNSRVLDFINE